MNTSHIKIGNRQCYVGSIFSDSEIIHWTASKQAIQAQNLETAEIRQFVSTKTSVKNQFRTIKNFYIKKNNLAKRGPGKKTFLYLSEFFPETIYLWDSVFIDSPLRLDSNCFFYIRFVDRNGKNKEIITPYEHNRFVIARDKFDGMSPDDSIDVSLHYVYNSVHDPYLISDSIRIELIP